MDLIPLSRTRSRSRRRSVYRSVNERHSRRSSNVAAAEFYRDRKRLDSRRSQSVHGRRTTRERTRAQSPGRDGVDSQRNRSRLLEEREYTKSRSNHEEPFQVELYDMMLDKFDPKFKLSNFDFILDECIPFTHNIEFRLKLHTRSLSQWPKRERHPVEVWKYYRKLEDMDSNFYKWGPTSIHPAVHQAVRVGDVFYEGRKTDETGQPLLQHTVRDGYTGIHPWLKWVNNREVFREGVKAKFMGYTYYTAKAIHDACKREETVAFVLDEWYTEWSETLQIKNLEAPKPPMLAIAGRYNFFDHNCNHFVEGLLRRIIKKGDFVTSSIEARSEKVLQLAPKAARRLLMIGYDVYEKHNDECGWARSTGHVLGERLAKKAKLYRTQPFVISMPACGWCRWVYDSHCDKKWGSAPYRGRIM
jgi:hypothetical protein